ncbi:MAG: MBL fold metallo-hydrolase [Phycisphaeraceae bacterium]
MSHALPQTPLLPPTADLGSLPAPDSPRLPRLRREAFRLCVLGSGSGGNCTVVHFPASAHTLLLDLGFGPRTTERRLAQVGLTLDDIDAVCLTHLDQDHFRRSWPNRLIKHRIPLHLHHWHRPDLHALQGGEALEDAGLVHLFHNDPFPPQLRSGQGTDGSGQALPSPQSPTPTPQRIIIHTARCQHDRQGTIAYRIDAPLGSLGYATDLGHVPPSVIQHLAGVDLLAIESNYDEQMTIHSPRPSFVNRRNMSDSGHLSNEQAYDAVQRIAAASPHGNPRHVVLLHRSSQCNHPMKVRRVFERSAPLARRVLLTEQRRRTRWIAVRPLRSVQRHQMTLTF